MRTALNRLLLVGLSIVPGICSIAQNNANIAGDILRREWEVSSFAGASERGWLLGAQWVYRRAIGCSFMLGGGLKLWLDEQAGGAHSGIHVDLSRYIGKKWSLGGQIGMGFYEKSFSYGGINNSRFNTKESKERFFQFSADYRITLGRKTRLLMGAFYKEVVFRTVTEVFDSQNVQLNPFIGRSTYGGAGLRIGLAF